jgi:hypothetical protein
VALIAQKRKLSKETAESLDSVFKRQKCKIFFTDAGNEYKRYCNAVYTQYNIKHVSTTDFATKAAPAERMILYVKQKLYKIMNSEKTFKWIDKLDAVINAINNSYNRTLKMTPLQAGKRENRSKVFLNTVTLPEDFFISKTMKINTEYTIDEFSVGDIVRIQMHQPFGKSYVGNFSEVLYVIYERVLKGGLYVFYLKELLTGEPLQGLFYQAELKHAQIAGKSELPKIEKIHGFRFVDNKEEVKVNYEGNNAKVWIPYANLIKF